MNGSEGSPGIRILYIDDDQGLARLVERALTRHGFTVTTAESGDEGLRHLRSAPFDVVALDHFMPGKEGLEVLAEIRSLPEPPPVIYVTGADEGRIAVSALKAGAADYVIKDVSGAFLDLLRTAVEQALESASLRQQKQEAEREVRQARDRAEMLLREVNHRVANSLHMVASLVVMQTNTVADPAARDALIETQNRIAAIAQIHRCLYTSEDVQRVELAAYLGNLIEELEAAMRAAGRQHAVRLEVEPIQVPTDKAISIGVIVVELVTNAYKYAYPHQDTGDIRVRLQRQNSEFLLSVEDDGIGWQGRGEVQGSGLGSRIIRAMASSLRTTLSFDPDYPGTRAMLPLHLGSEEARRRERVLDQAS